MDAPKRILVKQKSQKEPLSQLPHGNVESEKLTSMQAVNSKN